MQWVPAPLANYGTSQVGWSEKDQYVNGGSGIRRSTARHKELSLSWPVQGGDTLAPIAAILQRPGPFYFMDPIDAQHNIAPSYWADMYPGGPFLFSGREPSFGGVSTPNLLGYSTVPAVWTGLPATTPTRLSFEIPPRYRVFAGVHGVPGTTNSWRLNTSAGVPTLATTSAVQTNMHLMNTSYSDPLRVTLSTGTSPDAVTAVSGIIIRLQLEGDATHQSGRFIPGMGHMGLQLDGDISYTSYSSELPNAQRGLSASFTEVSTWM